MNEKYVALYARVSTDAQREDGYSIDAQKELLSAFCQAKGMKKNKFFVDGGFSGANMQRPALVDLIEAAKKGELTGVIVYKLDRLSRSQKDTLYLIEDVFNPNGVDFISLNENMDTSTPIGRAMLGIMSAFAQLERETIKERTRLGMKERVKTGLWPGGGKIPFGYDYDKKGGFLVPNADAVKVKEAYELLLKGYAPNKIAVLLGLNYEKQAAELLRRKTNIGYIVYNGVEYKGKHEPIIDEETYHTAQTILAARGKNRMGESSYLLAGLLYCGKCGAKMRYAKWGNKGMKLYCYSQQKSKPYLVHDPDCDNKKVWADEVEKAVIEDIFALTLAKNESEKTSLRFDEKDYLLKEQQELQQKIKRLYNLYAKDDNDLLLATLDENKKSLSIIEKALARTEEKQKRHEESDAAKKLIKSLKDAWTFMELREKQTVLRRLINKIIINDEKIEIFYKFS